MIVQDGSSLGARALLLVYLVFIAVLTASMSSSFYHFNTSEMNPDFTHWTVDVEISSIL